MDGKQLRNSILQWAIQGKLVPQDPNDEPASVLLERIREEKARLVKEKKIKRDKNESIIYRGEDNSYYEKFLATGEIKCINDEIPFDLPRSWEWSRLRYIIKGTGAGKSPNCEKRPKKDSEWGVLTTTAVQYCDFLPNENKVLPEKYTINAEQQVEFEDLLITRAGPRNRTGIVCVVNKVCNHLILSDKTVRIDYIKKLCNPYFLMYVLNSSAIHDRIMAATVGMADSQVNISQSSIQSIIVPIPPLNEQTRIVGVINSSERYCYRYSKAQLSLNNLNETLHKQIKKSILQEAIQGRLVKQSATDEPATVLLEQIKAEKKRLVKEGKLKKSALEESVIFKSDDNKYYENLNGVVTDITDQIPFDIPMSWQWVRLKSLCNISTGASFKKEEATTQGDNKVRILRGGNILSFKLVLKDDDIFIDRSIVNEKILLRENDLVTPAVTSLENICKMARVEQDYDNITMGGFVFIIRGYKNDRILSHYLQCVFSSPTTIEFVRSITNKSGQAFYNIGKERLSNTLIPIPPYDEMERTTSQIDVIFQSLN